jgi:predicted glutamine amidotransferase
MATWQEDSATMTAFDAWVCNQAHDMNVFMENLMQFSDGTPPFAFMVVLGKFVVNYNQARTVGDATETEALQVATAAMANDPIVQQLVGQMMANGINRGVGLDE